MLDAEQRILHGNAMAISHGILAGMPGRSALAICPFLQCLPQQSEAESRALESLAAWCLQFSPRISLVPPQAILLEIGGSLKLFHGLAQLRRQIAQGLDQMAYQAQLGIAPTPLGAQVLARAGHAAAARSPQEFIQSLRPLPLQALAWPERLQERILSVGARTIGDCLDLPRRGFNQRYGKERGHQLEQLLGSRPDPLPTYVPPATYQRELDIAVPTRCRQILSLGLERLFLDLAATLRGLDCVVSQIDLRFRHARDPATHLILGLQSGSRDVGHWMSLLSELLRQQALPAQICAIEVRATQFLPLSTAQKGFWEATQPEQHSALLERLAARLGPSRLHGLASCQTHAPEQAWRCTEAGRGRDGAGEHRPRPLWLLSEPEPVAYSDLQCLSAVERLETGWWEQECRRDYYRAQTRQGQRVWVFRQHAPPRQWFIHGLFA